MGLLGMKFTRLFVFLVFCFFLKVVFFVLALVCLFVRLFAFLSACLFASWLNVLFNITGDRSIDLLVFGFGAFGLNIFYF